MGKYRTTFRKKRKGFAGSRARRNDVINEVDDINSVNNVNLSHLLVLLNFPQQQKAEKKFPVLPPMWIHALRQLQAEK